MCMKASEKVKLLSVVVLYRVKFIILRGKRAIVPLMGKLMIDYKMKNPIKLG